MGQVAYEAKVDREAVNPPSIRESVWRVFCRNVAFRYRTFRSKPPAIYITPRP